MRRFSTFEAAKRAADKADYQAECHRLAKEAASGLAEYLETCQRYGHRAYRGVVGGYLARDPFGFYTSEIAL